ncbi:MAG: lytic transglycosylase domain-containing protein, partial [Pseudomonadota bacterium]|nr:lytic transglycosylase domain-containing protein [Pseudomonadota bacterium]
MNIAATYPETFYGVMAVQAAGQRYDIDFSLPAITDDFRVWLAAQKGGQRALALLQVGNWTRAARELRYLVEEMPPAFKHDLIAFATRNHMPGLAFRLADLHQRNTGEQIYAALYPLLSEKTDFVVDEALVLAIIRKESGFYPLARSRARAAGLMQLMPATAAFIAQDRRYRRTHKHKLHDPALNLHLGQKYIGHLLAEPHINGDLVRMLAAYNGGPGNLNNWLRNLDLKDDSFLLIESIPARETRNYIKGVL